MIIKQQHHMKLKGANIIFKRSKTGQSKFRKKLINRYKKCIVTDYPADVCDAAHIIPYSKSIDAIKYDINNGLLLRKCVHKLFDEHKITINPHKSTI